MRHSSDSPEPVRGQVEPLAAITAVFAVSVALALYAGVVGDAVVTHDRETAEIALDRAVENVTTARIVDPNRETIERIHGTAPEGWQANVTLRSDGFVRAVGPEPPPEADQASRRVAVRLKPGTVRPGLLQVVIWR